MKGTRKKKKSIISILNSYKSRFIIFICLIIVLGIVAIKPPSSELLAHPLDIKGDNSGTTVSQSLNPDVFQNANALRITYNLHGHCLLTDDASQVSIIQNGLKSISLSSIGDNCKDGVQKIVVPLAELKDTVSHTSFNPHLSFVPRLQIRIWFPSSFAIDISSIALVDSPKQVLSVTNMSSSQQTWGIQSIDAMKVTKDVICSQHSDSWIDQWVSKAQELGANYVAISTPYDSPTCGDSVAYTKRWIAIIRQHGMSVWHRDMPLAFEGIYNTPKNNANNFIDMITSYIKNNPDEYQDGDIMTPIPEPQDGGIKGVNYCAQNICQFSSQWQFNSWLRNVMTATQNTFDSIGKTNIHIGYFGFDGFIAWGDNNPDWHGILENSTVQQMGNVTIDHYPEVVHETMAQGLDALQTKYPNIPIVIGEWGTITGGNVDQQIMTDMQAAATHNVVGFNYWQFGPPGSGEQLINNDFSPRSSFFDVQHFYKL